MTLIDSSAFEIAQKVQNQEVSAVEVLEAALERIAAVDGRSGTLDYGDLTEEDKNKVHAFITLTADRAYQQAEDVDARLKAGEAVGPLAGVPVTVKDIFCVKGTPSTAASRMLANFTAPYTATPVERLEAAGALTLGKVNLDEFTYGSSIRIFCLSTRHTQSLEYRTCSGRVFWWKCRFGCRGRSAAFPGYGYRRFDPPTRGVLWCGWAKTDLRHGSPAMG